MRKEWEKNLPVAQEMLSMSLGPFSIWVSLLPPVILLLLLIVVVIIPPTIHPASSGSQWWCGMGYKGWARDVLGLLLSRKLGQ